MKEQSYLAEKLLESRDQDDSPVSNEWRLEIDRRLDEIDAGTAILVPHEQVMNSARQLVREL
ncbi:MAG: addiction module antitoxin RelB [Verrucomicrobiales bacterium VVV1]|nr:MAG: addiction module antitoxin RelB [Verrucomicrobiales bacterium VVV1]